MLFQIMGAECPSHSLSWEAVTPSSASVCVAVSTSHYHSLCYREGSVPVLLYEIVSGLLVSILLSDIQLDPKCRLNGWLKH